MKKFLRIFREISGHALFIIAVPLFAFYILEICNPAMHFLTNSFSLGLVAFFALLVVLRFIAEQIDGAMKKHDEEK